MKGILQRHLVCQIYCETVLSGRWRLIFFCFFVFLCMRLRSRVQGKVHQCTFESHLPDVSISSGWTPTNTLGFEMEMQQRILLLGSQSSVADVYPINYGSVNFQIFKDTHSYNQQAGNLEICKMPHGTYKDRKKVSWKWWYVHSDWHRMSTGQGVL